MEINPLLKNICLAGFLMSFSNAVRANDFVNRENLNEALECYSFYKILRDQRNEPDRFPVDVKATYGAENLDDDYAVFERTIEAFAMVLNVNSEEKKELIERSLGKTWQEMFTGKKALMTQAFEKRAHECALFAEQADQAFQDVGE